MWTSMDECVDDEYDLELGVALSLSQAEAASDGKPVLPLVRRKILPAVTVAPGNKKLLSNIHRDDKKMAKHIDNVIKKAFHTLQVIGGAEQTSSDHIDVETLEIALTRLGYPVGTMELQQMLHCYISDQPSGAILDDYTLYTRETVNGRNINSEWHPPCATPVGSIDRISIDVFRDIFLDCNLRMEKNGIIY